jgi:hypothetical protein
VGERGLRLAAPPHAVLSVCLSVSVYLSLFFLFQLLDSSSLVFLFCLFSDFPACLFTMVLQDLGRRINSAVNDLTRSNNLDEKVSFSTVCHV